MDKISKLINKISQKDADKIADIFELIKKGNVKKLNIKKLKGYPNVFRVRVGNYRIIYKIVDGKTFIIEVSKRNDLTYKKY